MQKQMLFMTNACFSSALIHKHFCNIVYLTKWSSKKSRFRELRLWPFWSASAGVLIGIEIAWFSLRLYGNCRFLYISIFIDVLVSREVGTSKQWHAVFLYILVYIPRFCFDVIFFNYCNLCTLFPSFFFVFIEIKKCKINCILNNRNKRINCWCFFDCVRRKCSVDFYCTDAFGQKLQKKLLLVYFPWAWIKQM